MFPSVAIVLALLRLFVWDAPTEHSISTVRREAWVMGTRLQITVEGSTAESTAEAVLTQVEYIDRVLSTWSSDSEIGEVNAAPVNIPLGASADLTSLLAEAERWARRTDRAFDPTLGPLVDAWDLRGEGHSPRPDVIEAALAAAGPEAFSVDPRRSTVTRHSAAAWFDTGAFGKGAALREVARLLRESDVERALVDLGGQIWTMASPDSPWPVEVAHPRRRGEPVARLLLYDVSVATSGMSERPGHILDPRTGRPAPAWGSVTVVSADAFDADVLATALYVMGPEAGMTWALRASSVAALFLEETKDGLLPTWTPAMERWLIDIDQQTK